ncbi:MAG: Maf-like protein, partial [Caldilineae bacterium]
AVARYAPRALILAADTVVTLDGDVLGKPATPAEARAMLTRLRGRTHRVLSAVTVLHAESNRRYTTLSDTAVLMRPYTPAEVDAYIATGDPFDKAGGYAIQHPQFSPVARIEGCYAGVVGFPVGHVAEALAHFGVTFPPLAPLCAAFTGKPCCLATT